MAYIDATDLRSAASQADIDRYYDDDGDGAADASVVADLNDKASSTFDAKLLQEWAPLQVVELMKEPLAKMHCAYTSLHLAAKRKREWRDAEGNAPYKVDYAEAMKYLDDLVKGAARSKKEDTAGRNPVIGGNLNSDYEPPRFVFAGTRDKPAGSGGF
jgi:phage gp36-like protein